MPGSLVDELVYGEANTLEEVSGLLASVNTCHVQFSSDGLVRAAAEVVVASVMPELHASGSHVPRAQGRGGLSRRGMP